MMKGTPSRSASPPAASLPVLPCAHPVYLVASEDDVWTRYDLIQELGEGGKLTLKSPAALICSQHPSAHKLSHTPACLPACCPHTAFGKVLKVQDRHKPLPQCGEFVAMKVITIKVASHLACSKLLIVKYSKFFPSAVRCMRRADAKRQELQVLWQVRHQLQEGGGGTHTCS